MNSITCPHCPTEEVAKQIARDNQLSEYLIFDHGRHHRKWLDGHIIAHATYEIEYWHGLVRAARVAITV